MGLLKSILEPLGWSFDNLPNPEDLWHGNCRVIAAVFTVGAWINREDVPWYDDLRTALLKDDDDSDPEHDGLRANGLEASQVGHADSSSDTTMPSKDHRPNLPTRILARFPFLLEILYWLLIYWIYQGSRAITALQIANHKEIFSKAEHHALQILNLETKLNLAIELPTQKFILQKAQWLMPILAQIYYSHIILGVIFYVYTYTFYTRPQYQRIRRTLALINILAFTILSLWRCTPPRLLPEEYGFIDILHSGSGSGSAWTQNKFQLTIAAMPSMHFGNSVFIAFCLGVFSPHFWVRGLAIFWSFFMGVTVLATANHFVLDCLVGVLVVFVAYWFDWVMLGLLPVERVVFRFCRLVKPGNYGSST